MNRSVIAGLALAALVPLTACGGSQVMDAMHDGQTTQSAPSDDMMHGGHEMDLGPADATYDLRFIDGMTPHHEGALVMAEAALTNSKRPEIRQLAENIMASQQAEIDQMKAWRAAWYPDAPGVPMMYHAEMKHDMPMDEAMISSMRMDMDLGGADDEFDRRFLDAMISHHEGAVAMAKDLKEKSDRPELKALADDIIASQQAEIDQMKQWRQAWYGQ
ncbi:DUF305 domain-containing protein [Nodosilinea nodulosa]|uniref:DUF305 domain-containing protein n=1 Tax=Nodosilinea nodulosa TaxID=416001 RepID=UPI0002F4705C|nr:DUF305 domain-containing protein [Nodosilinea nodulosa]